MLYVQIFFTLGCIIILALTLWKKCLAINVIWMLVLLAIVWFFPYIKKVEGPGFAIEQAVQQVEATRDVIEKMKDDIQKTKRDIDSLALEVAKATYFLGKTQFKYPTEKMLDKTNKLSTTILNKLENLNTKQLQTEWDKEFDFDKK